MGLAASSSASATAPTEAPCPIPMIAPSRIAPEDVGRQPADDAPREVLGTGERRRELDRMEPETALQCVRRRRLRGVAVDDPDLDDALGTGALRSRQTCGRVTPRAIGDLVLGFT